MEVESVKKEAKRSWETLLLLSQGGDKEAYALLLSEIGRFIVGKYSNEIGFASAEELSQEVLLRVHKNLHTWIPGRAFGPWIFAVIGNLIKDSWRRKKTALKHENQQSHCDFVNPIAESSNQLDFDFNSNDLVAELHNALFQLPSLQRSAIEQTKLLEFSVAQAALNLGVSKDNIKTSVSRGIKKLRTLIQKETE